MISLPAPTETVRVMCWPISLFGNPGAETGVEAIHDALVESRGHARSEPRSARHERAQQLQVQVWDYLSIDELHDWQAPIKRRFLRSLEKGEFPIFVGGNHLTMLPVYRAYASLDAKVCVVSFDAHLDVYPWKDAKEELSHGNFLLHVGDVPNLKIVNVGHREWNLRPEDQKAYDKVIGMLEILRDGVEKTISELQAYLSAFDFVHFDIDVDVLDSGVMRATGCPVPFGLSSQQLLTFLIGLSGEKVGAFTLTEFNSMLDSDGTGRDLVLWLLEYVIYSLPKRSSNQQGQLERLPVKPAPNGARKAKR